MKGIVIMLLAALLTMQLFSQSIEGIILNGDTQEPVSHANISVKNSTMGTVSNDSGFFSIDVLDTGKISLRISCLGFETQEKEVTSCKNQKIRLRPVSVQLNKSIVVTASRNELLSFQTPDAVSVITPQELKINAPRSMADALSGVTGVWMQKTNHGGGSPFVRGLTGNQTLLLIDGIRLNNATFRYGPNQYFNTIDIF
ncbi:carboxypeptidase-like regulatory domain-containing protein, partial [Mariniphaga sediminis]